jgi:quercetin dioxygenase-like cupin family protein
MDKIKVNKSDNLDRRKLDGMQHEGIQLDGNKSDGIESNGVEARKADAEVEKAVGLIIVEIIEYIPNSVVIKTIIKKSTGNISVMSFDTGEGLTEKTSPFDTFAQIIDGCAEIIIDGKSNILHSGEGIVIPAHRSNIIKANERFKMILTIIKSGYE